MSRALLAALALSLLAAHAPVQCTRTPDPDGRRDDQPGDALWALATRFREEGNRPASDETLAYLVRQYPSDRHAPAAKELLAGRAEAAPANAPGGDGGR
jgi:hypothetical protein